MAVDLAVSDTTVYLVVSNMAVHFVMSDMTVYLVVSDKAVHPAVSDMAVHFVVSDMTVYLVVSDTTVHLVVSDKAVHLVVSDKAARISLYFLRPAAIQYVVCSRNVASSSSQLQQFLTRLSSLVSLYPPAIHRIDLKKKKRFRCLLPNSAP